MQIIDYLKINVFLFILFAYFFFYTLVSHVRTFILLCKNLLLAGSWIPLSFSQLIKYRKGNIIKNFIIMIFKYFKSLNVLDYSISFSFF